MTSARAETLPFGGKWLGGLLGWGSGLTVAQIEHRELRSAGEPMAAVSTFWLNPAYNSRADLLMKAGRMRVAITSYPRDEGSTFSLRKVGEKWSTHMREGIRNLL
jgi:hypothetical protein